MKPSIISLYSSDRRTTSLRLVVAKSDTVDVVFGTLTFDEVTADFTAVWTVDCTLSALERLGYILKFVKFLITR